MNPITIEYKEILEELELETHYHNQHEIIFINEGIIKIEINGREYEADENSIIFISNLETHHLKVLKFPYKRHLILLNQDFINGVVNEPILLSILKYRPAHFNHIIKLSEHNYSEITEIIKLMTEEVEVRKAFWEINIKHYINTLFISLYRYDASFFPSANPSKAADTFYNIQKYVEEHCLEDISLKSISKLFFSDMYYVSRTFKKIIGFSFKEYLILQRLAKAKDMLLYSNNSISQICIQSGFANVNHFIRIFKKYEGITPYQYRKALITNLKC